MRTAAGTLLINNYVELEPIQVNIPVNSNCIFYIHKFHNYFDGLVGNNILINNEGKIDYEKKFIELNKTKIPLFFSQREEQEYDNEINYLNNINPHLEIYFSQDFNKDIRITHLNKEEKMEYFN